MDRTRRRDDVMRKITIECFLEPFFVLGIFCIDLGTYSTGLGFH